MRTLLSSATFSAHVPRELLRIFCAQLDKTTSWMWSCSHQVWLPAEIIVKLLTDAGLYEYKYPSNAIKLFLNSKVKVPIIFQILLLVSHILLLSSPLLLPFPPVCQPGWWTHSGPDHGRKASWTLLHGQGWLQWYCDKDWSVSCSDQGKRKY